MEDVLDLYAEPVDPRRPVVCFDESPYQLIQETRSPWPATLGRARRDDYEYKRAGTANLFLLVQPLAGWRHVEVTERRTSKDFAHQMRAVVDDYFPEAQTIQLVVDNLNTHTPAALYTAFPAAEARRITRRLAFHYTPKHGSWLNMAEIELAVLADQCLDRRLGAIDLLRHEVAAWEADRNRTRATVNWRFTTTDARLTLPRMYPNDHQKHHSHPTDQEIIRPVEVC
jgi:hypothetical protein